MLAPDTKTLTAKNWILEQRDQLLSAKRIIIKVGSAVLANENGLDRQVIKNIVDQVAFLRRLPIIKNGQEIEGNDQHRDVVLVSSGAVAAGRAALKECCMPKGHPDTTGLAAKQAAAAVGQCRLMHHYDVAFAEHGLGTAQVLLTRDDLRSRERFLHARNTFAELLQWGVVPVVNENDTVSVRELKFGDNDCLASLLMNLVEGDLFINLTSAAGVLDANPLTHTNAQIMPCIESVRNLDLDALCGGKTAVGTGGMFSKLLAAKRVAQLGVPTLILPGREKDIVRQVYTMAVDAARTQTNSVESIGTWVRPEAHSISRRKFWLAYQSEPCGTVVLDAGAVHALEQTGSSLLPGGIIQVDGEFSQGSLISLVAQTSDSARPFKHIGVGLSNYSHAEIKRIMGLKRHEVAAILGNAHYCEVIHRDNLLLDAIV